MGNNFFADLIRIGHHAETTVFENKYPPPFFRHDKNQGIRYLCQAHGCVVAGAVLLRQSGTLGHGQANAEALEFSVLNDEGTVMPGGVWIKYAHDQWTARLGIQLETARKPFVDGLLARKDYNRPPVLLGHRP